MTLQMRRGSLTAAVLAAALIVPLSACSALPGSGSGADSAGSAADLNAATMTKLGDASAAEDGAPSNAASAGRSVVRSGSISIEVDDAAEAAEEVADIAEGLGGYVESESVDNTGGAAAANAYLTVRVPADRLDDAFTELGGVGDVRSQSREASDVTARHVDLQARVQALQGSVERLTELMARAKTTGDLLEAERELAQRQQELDGLRAQLDALEGQVAEATISVSLGSQSALPGGPANFWEGLVAGWGSIVAAGAGALVLLGILLPWLAVAGVLALVIVAIVRAARRRGRNRSELPEPPH